MGVSGFNPPTPSISLMPRIFETSSDWKDEQSFFLHSFYVSNVTDFTRNRQVIQVYSLLVRSPDLKIVNQNNNLLTTIIINDPTTNYCRSVEDICIPMITRFDRLMFLCLRFGRRNHAIERRIRTPVDDRRRV